MTSPRSFQAPRTSKIYPRLEDVKGQDRSGPYTNRILKAQLKGRLRLSDAERHARRDCSSAGRKVLGEVANVARPDTILAWYRKLVARKFNGSKARRVPGRPR
jgi:hypothetical protein